MSLEYLAGFFDGEGSIYTRRAGRVAVEILCAVSNTVKESVELFQARFGGHLRLRVYKDRPRWKPLWTWEIKSRHAEAFLREMLPLLQVKRMQAEIALELLSVIPRRGAYTKKSYQRMTTAERSMRDERLDRRLDLVASLRAVNHRGLVQTKEEK